MDGMAEGAVTTSKITIENVFYALSTVLGRAQTLQKESNALVPGMRKGAVSRWQKESINANYC